jgi:hypothetical protein
MCKLYLYLARCNWLRPGWHPVLYGVDEEIACLHETTSENNHFRIQNAHDIRNAHGQVLRRFSDCILGVFVTVSRRRYNLFGRFGPSTPRECRS